MPTSAPAVKAAVFALCQTLYEAPTMVTYGTPGPYQPEQIVGVMGQTTTFAVGPLSPARRRDELVETRVVFSVFRGGDESGQQAATEAAYALATLFVDHFQTSPNETLSGACREARVTESSLIETTVMSPQNPTAVTGVSAEVTVTLTTIART